MGKIKARTPEILANYFTLKYTKKTSSNILSHFSLTYRVSVWVEYGLGLGLGLVSVCHGLGLGLGLDTQGLGLGLVLVF